VKTCDVDVPILASSAIIVSKEKELEDINSTLRAKLLALAASNAQEVEQETVGRDQFSLILSS